MWFEAEEVVIRHARPGGVSDRGLQFRQCLGASRLFMNGQKRFRYTMVVVLDAVCPWWRLGELR